MASGYIGKISAVVTANTSDLTKKLADAGQNTKRFSENLNRSISSAANSAQNSLQKIFTPLQNIERRLQTSLKVPGLALPLDEIRQAVSITEQLNKPLASVREGFSRLSLNVQAAFLPALQGAQDEVVKLNLLLQNTGNVSEQSLERARLAVEKLAAAQARLQQAQQIAARGNTGRELQFTDPRAYESLNRTAQLTQRAGSLPAAQLADGSVAKLVRELDRLQQVTQRSQAQLESLRLSPNVDTTALADAERRLERVIALARITQDQLETALTPPPSDATVTDEEIKALIEKERRSKETEERMYAAKKQVIDRETQDLIDKERRAQQTEENIYRTKKEITDKEIADLIAKQQRAKQVESLTNNNRSSQFLTAFGGGSGGLSAAFDERAIRSYSAQLQVLQAAISKASAEARGPAYTAFLKLRDAIADAMDRGELETEQTRQKLKALTTEAVNATASITGIGAKGLGRSVERAGDIGRAGFDKFSLAANQAAFAIDDFLSATGGIEFRIRAVQNNLTQLAFILGGTEGLFIGLGVAIAAQATIALVQFANEGRSTEDVLKSLNENLERQRTLAEELAQAFRDISDTVSDGVFSDAKREADDLADSIQAIVDRFQQFRETRAAETDPLVQQQEANANRAARLLQTEENPGRRVLLIAEQQQARASAEALSRRTGDVIPLDVAIQRFRDAVFDFELQRVQRSDFSRDPSVRGGFPEQAAANIDRILAEANIQSASDLRSLAERRIREQSQFVNTQGGVSATASQFFTRDSAAASDIGNLRSLVNSLQDFSSAGRELEFFASEAARISSALADSRASIEDFGDGIASAGEYSSRLDEAGESLKRAVDAVAAAQEAVTRSGGNPEDLTKAIADTVAEFNAESEARAQLVAEIASVFNEEAAKRREAGEKAVREIEEAAQKRRDAERRSLDDERRRSAERGRELLQTDREARVEQLRQSIIDIENALKAAANVDNARQARRATNQFLDAEFSRQAAQVAPGLIALQVAVDNAVASGPSRQALNAADISTQQGTAELNRLLRGDDPANAQIVELQKQTQELVGLRQDFNALRVAD